MKHGLIVRVLFGVGFDAADYDFICNWLGNKAWTLQFKWSGHDAFNSAEDKKVRSVIFVHF